MTENVSAEAVPASESVSAESAAQPDERTITVELDSEVFADLQQQYARLNRNPGRSFDDFMLTVIHIGMRQLREMPAEEALDLLADQG